MFAGYTQDDYALLDFDWNLWDAPNSLRRRELETIG
jgi:hypothetical protein